MSSDPSSNRPSKSLVIPIVVVVVGAIAVGVAFQFLGISTDGEFIYRQRDNWPEEVNEFVSQAKFTAKELGRLEVITIPFSGEACRLTDTERQKLPGWVQTDQELGKSLIVSLHILLPKSWRLAEPENCRVLVPVGDPDEGGTCAVFDPQHRTLTIYFSTDF